MDIKGLEVYISYSWAYESDKIADEVEQYLEANGIDVKRDKKNVGYKDNIVEFENAIGRGAVVIVIVSEDYLKSPNCMYEMVKLSETGNLQERLFPIVLDDARIYDASEKTAYVLYWQEKTDKITKQLSDLNHVSRGELCKDIADYSSVCKFLSDFLRFLGTHNNLSASKHSSNGYSEIIDSIKNKYSELLERHSEYAKDIKLKFEKNTLSVLSTGGEYRIKIDANIPFNFNPLDNSTQQSTCTVANSSKNLFGPLGTVVYSKELTTDNYLKIRVNPASSRFMEATQINIYSHSGKYSDCLTIVQEGDCSKPFEVTINETSIITSLCSNMLKSFGTMHTMEAFYTQCWRGDSWSSYYDHILSPFDDQIKQLFTQCYQIIRLLHTVEEHYDEEYIKSTFSCIEALLYYQMEILWGNIPYVASTNLEDAMNSKQLKCEELFAIFEKDLLYCIDAFSTAKTGNNTVLDMVFPSKDVPRMILARMYMYINEYAKALSLLQSIIDSNNYSLEPNRLAAVKKDSKELIYSYLLSESIDNTFKNVIEVNDVLPVISYAEVLLCAAECEYHLGDNSKAIVYLNKVNQVRGLTLVNSSDFLISLQTTWKNELKGTGTYFPFLKRNNLAEKILNIKSYQLLFPFPMSEINRNPNITQNPGY